MAGFLVFQCGALGGGKGFQAVTRVEAVVDKSVVGGIWCSSDGEVFRWLCVCGGYRWFEWRGVQGGLRLVTWETFLSCEPQLLVVWFKYARMKKLG